jgi:hypothetical protein
MTADVLLALKREQGLAVRLQGLLPAVGIV